MLEESIDPRHKLFEQLEQAVYAYESVRTEQRLDIPRLDATRKAVEDSLGAIESYIYSVEQISRV